MSSCLISIVSYRSLLTDKQLLFHRKNPVLITNRKPDSLRTPLSLHIGMLFLTNIKPWLFQLMRSFPLLEALATVECRTFWRAASSKAGKDHTILGNMSHYCNYSSPRILLQSHVSRLAFPHFNSHAYFQCIQSIHISLLSSKPPNERHSGVDSLL